MRPVDIWISVVDPGTGTRSLTKLGRSEAAPKAGVPLVAMRIDSSRLNAEVILLKVAWEMLIEHCIGLGRAFFG
jgi:hypothetical protein